MPSSHQVLPIDGEQPMSNRDAAGTSSWQPRIIAFLCSQCSYVAADLAGTNRMEYPATVRIIRVPCSGHVDPMFILRSFQQGADGVIVSGCHPGDCHYGQGNFYARRRIVMFRKLLQFTGVDPRRVQMSWVSAHEGHKWAQVVTDTTHEIRALGPLGHQEFVDGRDSAEHSA